MQGKCLRRKRLLMVVPWDKEEKRTLTSHFEIFVVKFFSKMIALLSQFQYKSFSKKKRKKEKKRKIKRDLQSSFFI